VEISLKLPAASRILIRILRWLEYNNVNLVRERGKSVDKPHVVLHERTTVARVLVLATPNPFQHYLWVTESNRHFFHLRQFWQWISINTKRDISRIHFIGGTKEKGVIFLQIFILPLTSRAYPIPYLHPEPFLPTLRALLHPFLTHFGEESLPKLQGSRIQVVVDRHHLGCEPGSGSGDLSGD
jgi:hypothetical protein